MVDRAWCQKAQFSLLIGWLREKGVQYFLRSAERETVYFQLNDNYSETVMMDRVKYVIVLSLSIGHEVSYISQTLLSDTIIPLTASPANTIDR